MKKSKKVNVPKRELKTRKPSSLQDVKTSSKVTGLSSVDSSAKAPDLKKVKTKAKAPDLKKTKMAIDKPFMGAKGLKASAADYKMKKILKKKKK